MGLLLLVILAVVFINLMFASLMSTIARSKGHKNTPVFALVFFFGILGMLYVIALPDLEARQQREHIIALLFDVKQQAENCHETEHLAINQEDLEALNDLIKCED